MKIFIQSFMATLFILAMSMPVQALTGNELLKYCEEGNNEALKVHFQSNAFCLGYVTGASEGLFYADNRNVVCFSDGVTVEQLKKVVMKYLNDNPQKLHESYVPLIYSSIKEAFPCKKTERNAR